MNREPPMEPSAAYKMLYDYFYRVARWPEGMDVDAIHAGFRAIKTAIEQNEILRRDLAEINRAIESERKARASDIEKIDSLQKRVRMRNDAPQKTAMRTIIGLVEAEPRSKEIEVACGILRDMIE